MHDVTWYTASSRDRVIALLSPQTNQLPRPSLPTSPRDEAVFPLVPAVRQYFYQWTGFRRVQVERQRQQTHHATNQLHWTANQPSTNQSTALDNNDRTFQRRLLFRRGFQQRRRATRISTNYLLTEANRKLSGPSCSDSLWPVYSDTTQ